MENKLIFLILLLFPLIGKTQTSFHKVYSGNGYDRAEGVAQFLDSSYLVTGSSSSFEDAPSQLFLMHLNKDGSKRWSRAYGGNGFESGKRCFVIGNDALFTFGTSTSGISTNHDVYVLKTDTSGNVLWEEYVDLGNWDRVTDVLLLPDTSFIICAETNFSSDNSIDGVILKMNKNGTILWQHQLENPGEDNLNCIRMKNSSNIFIGGKKYVADSLKAQAYVAKIDTSGNILWEKTIAGEGWAEFNDLVLYNSDMYAIGGTQITETSDYDPLKVTVNFDGTVGGSEFSINTTNSTNFIFAVPCGTFPSTSYYAVQQLVNTSIPTYINGSDAFMFRFDYTLNWDNYGVNYGYSGEDKVNQLFTTMDGKAISVGYLSDFGPGGESAYVIKMNSCGTFPTMTLPQNTETIVGFYEEIDFPIQVYPNPFDASFHIQSSDVTLKSVILYSLNGIELARKEMTTETIIDTVSLSSGVYFVKIVTGNSEKTVKVCKQ